MESEWQMKMTPLKEVFWYNPKMDKSSWQRPVDSFIDVLSDEFDLFASDPNLLQRPWKINEDGIKN